MQKIAVCGKGGSGKSVVVSLLAAGMRARSHQVLVVDADESNTGLHRILGFASPPSPIIELLGGKTKLEAEIEIRLQAGENEMSLELMRAYNCHRQKDICLKGVNAVWKENILICSYPLK